MKTAAAGIEEVFRRKHLSFEKASFLRIFPEDGKEESEIPVDLCSFQLDNPYKYYIL